MTSIKSTTISGKVYKFVHHSDVWLVTNFIDREYESEFLRIEPTGKITIKGSSHSGYAWDGCTPKVEVLDLIIGTPDGRLDYQTEKPITYYAFMVHDAIYQYKNEVPISRKEADLLFKAMLKDASFNNVKETTVLHFDTNLGTGGIVNIPFIVNEANATEMQATFWIMELEDSRFIMQYSQTVMLDFFDRPDGNGLIKWQHVSINTLIKQ